MNPAAPSLAKRGAPFVKARGAASTFHVCDLIEQCCVVLNGIYPVVSVPLGGTEGPFPPGTAQGWFNLSRMGGKTVLPG